MAFCRTKTKKKLKERMCLCSVNLLLHLHTAICANASHFHFISIFLFVLFLSLFFGVLASVRLCVCYYLFVHTSLIFCIFIIVNSCSSIYKMKKSFIVFFPLFFRLSFFFIPLRSILN